MLPQKPLFEYFKQLISLLSLSGNNLTVPPLRNGWTSIHKRECYSAIKRNELLVHTTERILKCIMHCERSQTPDAKYWIIPLIMPAGKKLNWQITDLCCWWEWGLTRKWLEENLWCNESVLYVLPCLRMLHNHMHLPKPE